MLSFVAAWGNRLVTSGVTNAHMFSISATMSASYPVGNLVSPHSDIRQAVRTLLVTAMTDYLLNTEKRITYLFFEVLVDHPQKKRK